MKYELIKTDFKIVSGIKLFRLRAISDFGTVKAGDLGGYIESEFNLSQCGLAWVSGEALVYGAAWVSGDAQIYGKAQVYGAAEVSGNARVSGEAQVFGEAQVYGAAWVSGEAQVFGKAQVSGAAQVYGAARVSGNARILQGYVTLSLENKRYSLITQLGVCLVNNEVILYKKVNKISEGKYKSCYDSSFTYGDGEVAEVINPDLTATSCAAGIHLSTANYWSAGDTLIACKVQEEDIITIQQGKVRVARCLVLGEVKI